MKKYNDRNRVAPENENAAEQDLHVELSGNDRIVIQLRKPKAESSADTNQRPTFEKFRVIELCAGLGGTRLGVEQTGVFKVVQSSEIDKAVSQTYIQNFGDFPVGDFTKIPMSQWQDCEVIAASLPCQSFSMAGNKKGLKDKRGALFFDFMKIVEAKKPKAFFIENVVGMVRLQKGRFLRKILKAIKQAGYFPHWTILKASDFGVPQARERLFIVAFDQEVNFQFPKPQIVNSAVEEIFEKNPKSNFFLSQEKIDNMVVKRTEYENKGHGFGFKILNPKAPSRTILRSASSRFKNLVPVPFCSKLSQKHGAIEIPDSNGELKKYHLRLLTPRECARLQGFPECYKFSSSETQIYQQLGNAVPVPVIKEIFKEIFLSLMSAEGNKKSDGVKSPPLNSGNVLSFGRANAVTNVEPTKKSENQNVEIDLSTVFGRKKKIEKNEKTKALVSWRSKDKFNHYMTPVGLTKFVSSICPIELDPASSPEANTFHKFPRIYTRKQNGLKQSWKVEHGNAVFANPPYDDLPAWANKISNEAKLNPSQPMFYLVPAKSSETRWCRILFENATHVVFLKKRLIHNELISDGVSKFPSAIFIFNGDCLGSKINEFRKIGSLLVTEVGLERLEKPLQSPEVGVSQSFENLKLA